MKKLLSTLSMGFLLASSLTMTSEASPITGASSWAETYVYAGISNNIIPTTLQNSYTSPITRGEFCALAVATYEEVKRTEITGRKSFSDTSDANVEKMASLGVVSGTSETTFSPDSNITREQAAVILCNLASSLDIALNPLASTFADQSEMSSWAVESIGKANATGLMNGTEETLFSPQAQFTREQSMITTLKLYSMGTGQVINSLLVTAQNEIDKMTPVETKYYTPTLSGEGISFPIPDFTDIYGADTALLSQYMVTQLNPLLYVALKEYEGIEINNYLGDVNALRYVFQIEDEWYYATDSIDFLETLFTLKLKGILPPGFLCEYKVPTNDGRQIQCGIVVNLSTDTNGKTSMSCKHYIKFLDDDSDTSYWIRGGDNIYKCVNDVDEAIYYSLKTHSFVDPNATPTPAPTPEPEPESSSPSSSDAKFRLESLSADFQADVAFLRGIGIEPYNDDSGSVSAKVSNGGIYISDASLLYYNGLRFTPYWGGVMQTSFGIPIFLSSDTLPYFFQASDTDYVYILTAGGFVKTPLK